MTNVKDGTVKTHDKSLRAKAKRKVDENGLPLDAVWLFPWLSKEYSVPQIRVSICDEAKTPKRTDGHNL